MNKHKNNYKYGTNVFAMDGQQILHDEPDLGIINGKITTNVLVRDVASFRGLYAPPFVSSDFLLELRLWGEKVPTQSYKWFPSEVWRQGRIRDVLVESSLALLADSRGLVLALTFINPTSQPTTVPIQFAITGGLDYNTVWEFARPVGVRDCRTTVKDGSLTKSNDTGIFKIATNMKHLTWESFSSHWRTTISMAPKSRQTFHVVLAVGRRQEVLSDVETAMSNPSQAIKAARDRHAQMVEDLFKKVPTLKASDPRLERWYNRSLSHFLLNQWHVREFKLDPYYSTGGINGGCVCSYLWDFGENWKIFSLYDPAALREHIKAFLAIDLTKHFAFLPINGEGFGPWYYVNQEKIIFLIYYYVLHSGDVAFLSNKVMGKTILDHAVSHALVGDNPTLPAVLVDYGSGNHHLELRKEYRYDHYLPDVNARRYAYYQAVDVLCKLAGKQSPVDFAERAQGIKKLVKAQLWSKKDRWFYWLDAGRNPNLRYTVQMFKLLGSGVLDHEQEAGLLSHLNEKEFLSDYGLHSMAKHDPAYDQVDIDNGGGGSCTCFPPQIIERLYGIGHPDRAEDILQRVLWWADRLPYWSDSIVANQMDYRRDTPLQNAIGSIAAAQSIIFGLFGVSVRPEGTIAVNPVPPSFSPEVELCGLKVRGACMDISVKGGSFTVRTQGKVIRSTVGKAVQLPASGTCDR